MLKLILRYVVVYVMAFAVTFAPNVYAAPGFFDTTTMQDYVPPSFDATRIKSFVKAHRPDRFWGKNGHYIDVFYDELGRLASMQSVNGNQYVLNFTDIFAKVPKSITVNGVEQSLPLQRSTKAGIEKYVFNLDADYDTLVAEYGDFIYSYQYAQSGNFTDKSFAVAEILSYIAEGAALGSIVGAVCAELTGADFMMAELYVLGVTLGSVSGAAFVVSWNAGYAAGTWLYQGPISSWLYAPGHP